MADCSDASIDQHSVAQPMPLRQHQDAGIKKTGLTQHNVRAV